MKHMLTSAFAVALLCGSAGALADDTSNILSNFYAGAALSRWNYDQQRPAAEGRLYALEVNGGFWFNPLLSAEVRLGTSLGDQEFDVGNSTWEVSSEGYGSVYWRPEVANDVAKLYGLLGYTHIELSADEIATAPSERSASEGGPSFGVGVGFHYTPEVTLNIEWKQLIDADRFEISGFTAGFDYRF